MKIKDLKEGMDDVEIEATIDYIVPMQGGYAKKWGVVYVADDTKDIKMIFYEDSLEKAEEGKKIRVKHAYVTTYNNELQLNSRKEHPIEFIDEE